MDKQRIWPRAIGAVAIVALVLVTNECYRHVRAFVDDVNQSKQEIASLKRELYVLQVQLDNRPGSRAAPDQLASAPVAPVAAHPPEFIPIPAPIGQTLPLPEPAPRPHSKAEPSAESKNQVSVVLLSDAKAAPAASEPSVKLLDGPKLDVQLIGAAK